MFVHQDDRNLLFVTDEFVVDREHSSAADAI